jgi:excisionase family DNA binding protein
MSLSDMQTLTIERPMRVKDAAKFLGVSVGTLYAYIKKGMPYHQKPGTFGWLYPSEINEWIKNK